MKILVIEDNPRLSLGIRQKLQKYFVVETASSGDAGLAQFIEQDFDCVILDLGLPDMPGEEVCNRLRAISLHTPIIILTGADSVESKVHLLSLGADDYITKPFNTDELIARLHALIRRRSRGTCENVLRVGPLAIDQQKRLVSRDGKSISLRKKEYDILEYLALNSGRILSRQMIINHAWSSTSKGWVGSVDVHIKQLRDKIDKPFTFQLIKTCYGVGYMLDPGVSSIRQGSHNEIP